MIVAVRILRVYIAVHADVGVNVNIADSLTLEHFSFPF